MLTNGILLQSVATISNLRTGKNTNLLLKT